MTADFPAGGPVATLDETSVELPVGDLAVRGTLVRPENPAPAAALLVHGWSSAAERHDLDVARDLARAGLTALAIDLPGHGRSEGVRERLRLSVFLDAVTAAYDKLAGPVPIVGIGSSFGGYLVARLAARRALHAIALRVPANYPDDSDRRPLAELIGPAAAEWRGRPLPARATAAMRALADFGGDVLVVQAGRDALVPAQSVENLVRDVPAGRLTHVVLPDAPHIIYADPASRDAADDLVATWIRTRTGLVVEVQADVARVNRSPSSLA